MNDDLKKLSPEEKVRYLGRGTVEIITRDELTRKIRNTDEQGAPLVLKYGVDPTAPEIHLGHSVPLRKLRHFQNVGYDVTFLIGDFTARIGDPSGRSTGRNAMTEEEVLANAETYKQQIFRILVPEQTKLVYNSDWLKPMTLEESIKLLSRNTVNNLVKRKSFQKRFEKGEPIAGHELIYPFLQAYDSVFLKADIELGGTDQYFNLIFGRDLQPSYGQEPQVVVTTPLLEGLDGNAKMSKSLGNTVGIMEPATMMYTKLMKVKDNLVMKYFDLLTDVDQTELARIELGLGDGTLHPMDAKKRLAYEITASFHDPQQAKAAQEEFVKVYTRGELPSDLEKAVIDPTQAPDGKLTALDLLKACNLAESSNQARRLIGQRGFSIDGSVVEDPYREIELKDEMVLKVGKRTYVQISYKK